MRCELKVRHNWRTDENELSVSTFLSLDMYLLCLICIKRVGTYIIAYFGKC